MVVCLASGCGTSLYSYRQGSTPAHINHPRNIAIWLDARFTPEQDKELEAAIDEWNGVFNGQIILKLQTKDAYYTDEKGKLHAIKELVTFRTTEEAKDLITNSEKSDLGWVIMDIPDDDPMLQGSDVEGVLAFVPGFNEHYGVFLMEHFGDRSLHDVALHEFGHLLGAPHISAPSLMNPTYGYNQLTCIDKVTVLEVANYWHIDPSTLNYCSTPFYP